MHDLLTILTKDELSRLETRSYKEGEVIFREEELCEKVGFVLKGNISIVSYTSFGNEVIYNDLKTGDIFGNNLIFSNDKKYRGNVVSMSDSTIGFLNKENLLKILKENQQFLIGYLEKQAEFGKSLNARIKLLSMQGADERLMFYFHINNNVIKFTTIAALASILGLQRETLSRLVNKYKKEKKILYSNHQLKLIV